MTQTLVNPRGVFRREENPIAPRFDSLDHKVLGIVDNGKVNADLFLENIENRLRREFTIQKVVRIRKSRVGTPAVFTEAFLRECDFAVNAFGD